MDIAALARQYVVAKEKFQVAAKTLIDEAIIPNDKNEFWDTLRPLCHDLKKIDEIPLDLMPSFIKTYALLKERLYKETKNTDLADSLPLLGKESCLKVMFGKKPPEIKPQNVQQKLEDSFVERLCMSLVDETVLQEIFTNV